MAEYTYKQVEKKQNKYIYEVTVDYTYYQTFEDKAFKEEANRVKMPGFRPGKAPKELVEKEVSGRVFTNAINKLLPQVSFDILTKENLNPLINLDYSLKEFDKEKGVIYTFTLFNQPSVDLETVKKIKVPFTKPEVKDEEIDDVIRDMITQMEKKPGEAHTEHDHDHEGHDHSHHDHDHNHDHIHEEETKTPETKDEAKTTKSEKMEPITDEIVKKLGYEDAKTYDELKKKIRETLTKYKDQQANNSYAVKVVEEAIKLADFTLPDEMVDTEVQRQEEDFTNRLKKIKLDQESYLKTQGTDIDKLRNQWKEEARDQIASDLILINFAIKEKLVPTDEEVKKEIDAITNPQVKAQYKSEKGRDYLRTVITRDKGLQKMLEVVKSN